MNYQRIALIPAYKPSNHLPDLVLALKKCGMSVVLVNDGSGEEYAALFGRCSEIAAVLHQPVNMGKGSALKAGLALIQNDYSNSEYVVVTVDADGQHAVADAHAVSQRAAQNPSALVIGSRRFTGDVPLRSRLGNTITRFVFRLSAGRKLQDTQTGLRAFTKDLIPQLLEIPGDRYEYEMNVLLHFARRNTPIIEHEIATIYIDDNASSHFNAVRDSARIYKEILKFSASSFTSFLIDYALFALFLLISDKLLLSNIAARVISASVNFLINRRFVFCSKDHVLRSAVKYVLLAAVILLGNTVLIHFLVNSCLLGKLPAKILTEIVLFLISWLVQKTAVFRKQKKEDGV